MGIIRSYRCAATTLYGHTAEFWTIGTEENQVIALLPDCALSFDLANGATFADLADRLDHLGEGHVGLPTAIDLTMGAAQQSMSVLQPRI